MKELDISGIDKAELLAALHNNTRALGMGRIHDLKRDLTVEEGRNILRSKEEQLSKLHNFTGEMHFDYLQGRPLKVTFKDATLRGVELYDRDAGAGMCELVVAAVLAGKTGRI